MKARFKTLCNLHDNYTDIAFVTNVWEGARGNDFAPPWSAIDLLLIPADAIPRVCVVDITYSPLDFTYRYWGTGITQMHNLDATKQSVRTIPPHEYGKILFEQYELVVTSKKPMTYICEFNDGIGLDRRYIVRRHPLSDDGETVTGVLSIEEYGQNRKELKKLFEPFAP